MATLSLRLSEEEKEIIANYSKINHKTISEVVLNAVLKKIEDEEDYKIAEKIIKKKKRKTRDIRELAKECGIDYEEL
ncbi:DUF1778 domain-containing protein [Fusobacterium nucleatum]|uniref:type II toxin-antitoxin system RelB family antitoxin n=1 Tax=Fusobacterium nucleatum TaxID=851 RepID=UPI0030D1463A